MSSPTQNAWPASTPAQVVVGVVGVARDVDPATNPVAEPPETLFRVLGDSGVLIIASIEPISERSIAKLVFFSGLISKVVACPLAEAAGDLLSFEKQIKINTAKQTKTTIEDDNADDP